MAQQDTADEFDPTLDAVEVNVARVMGHVLQKGFQLGGVLGMAVAAPLTVLRQRRKGIHPRSAVPMVVTAVYKTVLWSTATTGALGAAKLAGLEDLKAGVEDRAYRLHYNRGQTRADLFANVGTVAGAAAAAALLPLSAAALLSGGAMGAAVGLAAHVGSDSKPQD